MRIADDPDSEITAVLVNSIIKFEKITFDNCQNAEQYLNILADGVQFVQSRIGERDIRKQIVDKLTGDDDLVGLDCIQTELISLFDRAAAQLLQRAAVCLIAPIVELPIKK